MVPLQRGEVVPTPICANKLRMIQPVSTKAILQPANGATMSFGSSGAEFKSYEVV